MALGVIEASTTCFGATVRGPGHRHAGLPNQDRWLGTQGPFGALAVVSDGLGSRSEARKGAAMACRAVAKAVRGWHRTGGGDPISIISRIEPSWRELIRPSPAEDCAATCLFALASPDGILHVAGLGDGMAVVRASGAVEWVIGPRDRGFANETQALGAGADWRLASFPWSHGDVALLATDGVSDDLLPDRVGAFADWIVGSFGSLPPRERWRALSHELAAWPTPKHQDDKTLAVLMAFPRATS